MMNYVYILRCADDTLYCGWTTDLEKRVRAHNRGQGAKYTRSRRPVQLIYAEEYLEKLCRLDGASKVLCKVYPAHIALARFDEKTADSIMETLLKEEPDNSGILFEAAQYYAKKCDYRRAIDLYELAYEKDTDRPRFIDALQGISDIWQILDDFGKAAEAYGRIVDSLIHEWGMTEEVELRDAQREHARLLALAQGQ